MCDNKSTSFPSNQSEQISEEAVSYMVVIVFFKV
jgi:hypothetical protein